MPLIKQQPELVIPRVTKSKPNLEETTASISIPTQHGTTQKCTIILINTPSIIENKLLLWMEYKPKLRHEHKHQHPIKRKEILPAIKSKLKKEIRKVLGPQGTNTLLKKLKETIAPLNKRHTSSIYQPL